MFPRVSTVLKDLGFGGGWGSDYHLARGQALHKAIQLDLAETLDETSIHPDIAPGFAAWRAFRQQVPLRLISSECELSDPVWQFTGHPDLIALVEADGLTTLFDYKYTESPDLFWARHQLAAYRHLWDTNNPMAPITRMAVLQLTPNGGTFRLHPIPQAEWADLTNTFLAAVRVWHATVTRRRT